MANTFIFGLHGTGKSGMAVKLGNAVPAEKLLLAADPFQKDQATGKLTFPESYRRVDESILEDEARPLRVKKVIIVDDATIVRRKWKTFEMLLATPRQTGTDFSLSFHGFALCPDSLFVYCNKAICFRTSSGIPLSARWGMKKEMEWARKYIMEYGNIHSYYIVDNTKGSIDIVL